MAHAIEARTLSESAYRYIRDSILRNELLPNSPLSPELIAQKLGISPTPVREALKRLEADGLVTSIAHRGIRVAELSEQDVFDTYEVRSALEPFIAHGAAVRAARDLDIRSRLETLSERALCVQKHAEQPDADQSSQFEEYTQIDLELNDILLSCVNNQLMKGIFHRVSNHSLRIRSFVEAVFRDDSAMIIQEMNKEHLGIIERLLSSDGAGAERAVRDHLAGAMERTLAALEKVTALESSAGSPD